jgi:hypothetical protein
VKKNALLYVQLNDGIVMVMEKVFLMNHDDDDSNDDDDQLEIVLIFSKMKVRLSEINQEKV